MKEKTFLAGVICSCISGVASSVLLASVVIGGHASFYFMPVAIVSTAALLSVATRAWDRCNAILLREWKEQQKESAYLQLSRANDNGDHHRSQFLD